MSNPVLSVTLPMHGSDSSSSLASLEHLNDSTLIDDSPPPHHILDINTRFPPPRTLLTVTHDDSDDSDDDSPSSSPSPPPSRALPPAPLSTSTPTASASVHLLASARIRSGSSTSPDMAVEMQHIATARKESSNSPPFHIRLVDAHGTAIAHLPPDADDVFSLDTFAALHMQRRAQGKQLIIAQVTTRDKNRTAMDATVSSYYDALPLLKVLYKVHTTPQGVHLRHRYHQHAAINPINPLTNTCVIGDVAFFMTEERTHPHTAPYPPSPSSSSSASSPASGADFIQAQYIGTDYNFTFNPTFRASFLPHSVSSSDLPPTPSSSSSPAVPPPSDDFLPLLHHLLQQPQKPRHRPIPWEGAGADALHALVQASGAASSSVPHIPVRYVHISFPRAVVYGIIMALYGGVCFAVLMTALMDVINGVRSQSVDLSSEWYWLLAPPASALFDVLTGVLHETREPVVTLLFKVVVYVLYYTAPLLMLNGEGAGVNVGRRVVEMLMPALLLAYSTAWFMRLRRKTILD